jgi:hypothetical protein
VSIRTGSVKSVKRLVALAIDSMMSSIERSLRTRSRAAKARPIASAVPSVAIDCELVNDGLQ